MFVYSLVDLTNVYTFLVDSNIPYCIKFENGETQFMIYEYMAHQRWDMKQLLRNGLERFKISSSSAVSLFNKYPSKIA